jgi:hypothetical protein
MVDLLEPVRSIPLDRLDRGEQSLNDGRVRLHRFESQ